MHERFFQGFTDEELEQVTGKTWNEWCALLDMRNDPAPQLSSIAHYLIQHHHLRRLWAQMIAVYYKLEWCATQH